MPQNILLIEDDSRDANAVREALRTSRDGPFEVEWVRSCSEGLLRLTAEGKQDKQKNGGIAAVSASKRSFGGTIRSAA